MPFDPALPANGTRARASEMRAQFNALNDQNTATNVRIDNLPPPIPGPPGPQGEIGPQGPPPTSPIPGPLITDGRISAHQGDLAIIQSDPNGSGETGLIHSADGSAGTPIPTITARINGTTAYTTRTDPAGILDGAGTPTVQDGDLLRYDAPTQTWKPIRKLGTLFADLSPLTDPITDPPTQTEVQANRDRINEFLTRLQGM